MKTFARQKSIISNKKLLLVERNKDDEEAEKKNAFLQLFSKKSVGSKAKVTKKTMIKEKDTKQQLYFNVGGNTINKCDECGMEFNRILEDDVKMHTRYHSVAVEGYPWNIVEFTPTVNGYLHVKPPDKTNQKAWQKIVQALVMINKELGAAEQKLIDLANCHAFLHINPKSKKVDGCIIATPIESGFRVIPSEIIDSDPQDSNVTFDATKRVQAIGGVSRIWVSIKSRGQGIAKQLLDLMRLEMLFGVELSKNQIAFSQPTNMGQRLARSYFSRPDYLIYIED